MFSWLTKAWRGVQLFRARFRDRSLTWKDFDLIWWPVFFPFYLLPSFIFMALINTEEAFYIPAKHLAYGLFFIPLFIWFLLMSSRCLPQQPSVPIRLFRLGTSLFFAAFFSWFGIGFSLLANALTGPSDPVWVRGSVIKTDTYSGRWAGAIKKVTVQYNDREVELQVTQRDYERAKQTGYYAQQMKLGGLGYYYSWKMVYWH